MNILECSLKFEFFFKIYYFKKIEIYRLGFYLKLYKCSWTFTKSLKNIFLRKKFKKLLNFLRFKFLTFFYFYDRSWTIIRVQITRVQNDHKKKRLKNIRRRIFYRLETLADVKKHQKASVEKKFDKLIARPFDWQIISKYKF